MFRPDMKSTLLPLAMLWLAVHAVLLGAILSVKFLTAKAAVLLFMGVALLWFLLGRKSRTALPLPPGMV
jgi:dolichyl-phosphate-mannose--protein O-mannosyl transferase